jgi:uncharacterized HAD superfamily protein
MGQKRIGIDLDGTVADYMAAAIPLLQEHYGLTPDWTKKAYTIEEVFGLTRETRPEGMREFLYEELHFFRDLPKKEPDIEHLTGLLKWKGYKVYVLTARSGTPIVREDTQFWLDKHHFEYDDIFHVEDKAELCKLMRIHVMLEDEVMQIGKLQHNKINVVVPDQPWNQHLPEDPHCDERKRGRIRRVYNWQEAAAVVDELLTP